MSIYPYGDWPPAALLKLVEVAVARVAEEGTKNLRHGNVQQQIAMGIAMQTGASFQWLLQRVEETQPSPRSA